MKVDSSKSFPYPVLRVGSDDYLRVEFENNMKIEIDSQGTVCVFGEISLSDDALLSAIRYKRAEYVLLVRCSKTFYRQAFRSSKARYSFDIDRGRLLGKTEATLFLICKKHMSKFRSDAWHDDYDGIDFDFRPGMVLAADEPREFWIEPPNVPCASIFKLVATRDIEDGQWRCDPESQRVALQLSESDYAKFNKLRSIPHNPLAVASIMNGVYLPAVAWALNTGDNDEDGVFQNYRWFRSLDNRLAEIGCRALGQGTSEERFLDAQKLLDNPFATLLDSVNQKGG